jgi:hypothetical protein
MVKQNINRLRRNLCIAFGCDKLVIIAETIGDCYIMAIVNSGSYMTDNSIKYIFLTIYVKHLLDLPFCMDFIYYIAVVDYLYCESL